MIRNARGTDDSSPHRPSSTQSGIPSGPNKGLRHASNLITVFVVYALFDLDHLRVGRFALRLRIAVARVLNPDAALLALFLLGKDLVAAGQSPQLVIGAGRQTLCEGRGVRLLEHGPCGTGSFDQVDYAVDDDRIVRVIGRYVWAVIVGFVLPHKVRTYRLRDFFD
jgi:hypothetical protein